MAFSKNHYFNLVNENFNDKKFKMNEKGEDITSISFSDAIIHKL